MALLASCGRVSSCYSTSTSQSSVVFCSRPVHLSPRCRQAASQSRCLHIIPHSASFAGGPGNASFNNSSGSSSSSSGQPEEPLGERISNFQQAFWKFLRPHTIRGTMLGTTALVTRSLLESAAFIDWGLLPRALLGLVALLCGNGYIVGINQIYDVDIDIVNKPFLPIAAGELSPGLAWVLVIGLAALGVTIVSTQFGTLITTLYCFGLFLGTVYSIPPFRLKQFAVPAFMIIATVRGFLLNFGVYYATRAALGLPFKWSPAIGFITVFVTVFAIVIAVTKDLPDIEGDRANNIETFATRLGVERTSLLASALLLSNYVGAVALAVRVPGAFNVPVMIGVHMALAAVLVFRTMKLRDAKYSPEAIQSYYRWVWNLFYSEYAVFPFL